MNLQYLLIYESIYLINFHFLIINRKYQSINLSINHFIDKDGGTMIYIY